MNIISASGLLILYRERHPLAGKDDLFLEPLHVLLGPRHFLLRGSVAQFRGGRQGPGVVSGTRKYAAPRVFYLRVLENIQS
jgi:hypothetical protein